MTPLWSIRILFLGLCIAGGYAVSQVRPEYVGHQHGDVLGMMVVFTVGRRSFIFWSRIMDFSILLPIVCRIIHINWPMKHPTLG